MDIVSLAIKLLDRARSRIKRKYGIFLIITIRI